MSMQAFMRYAGWFLVLLLTAAIFHALGGDTDPAHLAAWLALAKVIDLELQRPR